MSFYTLTAFHIEWLVKVWNPADDNMLNLSPQIHLRFSAWKKNCRMTSVLPESDALECLGALQYMGLMGI